MDRRRRYEKRVESALPDRARTVLPGVRPWHVYVLTDESRQRFSISMAKDVDARVWRHRDLIGVTIRRRTPVLVLTEAFADRHTAIARMKRLRRWATPELRKLIEQSNPAWRDLSTRDDR